MNLDYRNISSSNNSYRLFLFFQMYSCIIFSEILIIIPLSNGRVQKYVTYSCTLLCSTMVSKSLKFSKRKIGCGNIFSCYVLLCRRVFDVLKLQRESVTFVRFFYLLRLVSCLAFAERASLFLLCVKLVNSLF